MRLNYQGYMEIYPVMLITELNGRENYPLGKRADFIKELIGRGGRVFITENDDYLFVEPLVELPK